MFNNPFKSEKTELEVVRTLAIAQLKGHAPDSDEYKKIIKHIAILSKQIDAEKPEKLSPNTIALILGNVGVAGLVLWFERDNVLTTKVHSFLNKNKS